MTDKKKPDDEISEEDLQDVAGGATVVPGAPDLGGGVPDVMLPAPGGSSIPSPYPNIGHSDGQPSTKVDISVPATTESGDGSTGST